MEMEENFCTNQQNNDTVAAIHNSEISFHTILTFHGITATISLHSK
jgi:hypothetical protein